LVKIFFKNLIFFNFFLFIKSQDFVENLLDILEIKSNFLTNEDNSIGKYLSDMKKTGKKLIKIKI
jgi:hypothetical protein